MTRTLIVLFLFGIAGCNQSKVSTDSYMKIPQERMAKMVKSEPEAPSAARGGSVTFQAEHKSSDVQKQMLIKRATIRFEVKNYEDSRRKINNIIRVCNAYVASENESRNDYQISNTMSIRVPASIFDNLIDSIVSQAKNLDERSMNVEDVTEEYVDTDARLKAKREIEKRYLEILKKAKNVSEILEVEEKLGAIREEIESAEGRLKYLSHQVSFSVIDLTFYEQKNVAPKHRLGWLSRSASAFVDGWNGITEFVISLISIWPSLCVIAVIIIFISRIIQKKRKKRALKA